MKGKKCAYEVKEGHFLGYHINLKGIKPRMEKIETNICMALPKTIKKVQCLNGQLTAQSRFL